MDGRGPHGRVWARACSTCAVLFTEGQSLAALHDFLVYASKELPSMGGKTFVGPGVGFGVGAGCGFGIGYGFGGGPVGIGGLGMGGGCGVGVGLGWGQGAAWGAKYIVIEPEFIQARDNRPKWFKDVINQLQLLTGAKIKEPKQPAGTSL